MPVEEARSEERRTAVTSRRTAGSRSNLGEALAVRNEEKGGVVYPIEPRDPVPKLRRQRARAPARPAELPLPLGGGAGGVPRALGRKHADRRGGGADVAAVGLLPLPGRDASRLRRRRQLVRDRDDRGSARARRAAVPGQRGRGEARRIRGERDDERRRGIRRLARRARAGARAVAGQATRSSRSRPEASRRATTRARSRGSWRRGSPGT